METPKEKSLVKRMEATAPSLTPVDLVEGTDYVCASEVYPKPKHQICPTLPKPSKIPRVKCVRKYPLLWQVCRFPPEINEKDILFRPIRWRCKSRRERRRKIPEPSLGAPIGLSTSSFGIKFLNTNISDQILQGFATNLIAFAEYFITPEVEWDEKVLNRVLMEGQNLFVDSKEKLHDGEKLKESNIKRTFTLCGNAFNLLVNEPFMVGQVVGKETAIPNLYWGLLKFFKKFQFCLLQINNWYTLIWKNANVYFLFDCFGRRAIDLQRDRKTGVAILVCLRYMENISHLIFNMSGIKADDFFTIRHIQIKSLVACGGKPAPDIVDRMIEYELVSPNYAILKGNIHLGSPCFKEIRLRHSLPVAFCALINAKIDPAPTWTKSVLDNVLKLGADFYKQWTHCDVSVVDLGIQDIPNRFSFGQFCVQIAVSSIAECGLWKCTPNYRNSDLTNALKRAFDNGINLLVQIQGRTYALWKKQKYYFVLDPYSHICCLEKKKTVTSALHMCGSLDKLCCVFTQALLELFEETKFVILNVKIIKLLELSKMRDYKDRSAIICNCLATPLTDPCAEVASLNESVLSVEGYDCQPEERPFESDSGDLDSPGMSQTRMDDYGALRREFADESAERSDECDESDEESGVDLDECDDEEGESDESGDEGSDADADDDDEDDDGDGEGKGKKGKGKKKKGKGKGKKGKGKKGKGKKGKDKKEKGKKEKKEKTKKEKKTKDKKDKKDKKGKKGKGDGKDGEGGSDIGGGDDHGEYDKAGEEEGMEEDARARRKPPCIESDDDRPPVGCQPNRYPGCTQDPQNLAVVGSENGSYESLCSLLKSAFRCADRVLVMTPWGNYIAFRLNTTYFIFDGCTCNLRSIRHMDLTCGTAGLLCFRNLHMLIKYIESGKGVKKPTTYSKRSIVDQICNKYCAC